MAFPLSAVPGKGPVTDNLTSTLAAFVFAFSLIPSGCSSDRPTDSVPALLPGTPVSIEESPDLRVGVVEGDPAQELHNVVTPFLMENGSLVVPVAGASEIRVFGQDGRFIKTLGHPGEGPGEFNSLDSSWPRGDTIEAFDDSLLRITRFFPDGSSDDITLERVRAVQAAVPGHLPDGWAVFGIGNAGMGQRDEVVVHKFRMDGSHQGEIALTEGMARYSTPVVSGPDPISPKSIIQVGRGEVFIAETLTPEIRVLDFEGEPTRTIKWIPDTPYTPESSFDAVVEAAVQEAGPEQAEFQRRMLEAFPVPDRVSVFWGIIVDTEGFIWIRPFDPLQHSLHLGGYGSPGAGGSWLILSPEGTQVGFIEVPEELEPTFITEDAVVGIRRDSLGVEFVQVHRLVRH